MNVFSIGLITKNTHLSAAKQKFLSKNSCFIDGIYNKLNSGFTFLKLYYQIEVVAGISNLVQEQKL